MKSLSILILNKQTFPNPRRHGNQAPIDFSIEFDKRRAILFALWIEQKEIMKRCRLEFRQ